MDSCRVKLKVRTDVLKSLFHRAMCFSPSFLIRLGTTKIFAPSGAEDLHPSLQPWLRSVPHRTAEELHLYPTSFRFISVLNLSLIDMGPLLLSQLNFPLFIDQFTVALLTQSMALNCTRK